ncbi:MAG: tetratricopeptide repeat protein [Pseudomonadota bacterium]
MTRSGDTSAEVARLRDAFGYETTLIAPADADRALSEWDRTVTAFLAHGAETPARLAAALEAAPLFPLALAAKGYFMLLLGRPELRPAAVEALAAIEPQGAALTTREQAMRDGLAAYLSGRLSAAADILDASLAAHPRDALLMKLTHAIRFVLGDAAGMRRSAEAATQRLERGHPHRGYALGCLAFALEETGAYVAAERAGREAVRLTPTDAWGLHAVAHVLDMTNRAAEGVAWISGRVGAWKHCNNFGYHIWWHLALFHLERGEHREVLRLYDEEIRQDRSDDYRDISNAASLLSRLEGEGVDVGDRWEELATLSEARVEDGCVVFADLHYLLALGGAGREQASARLVSAMRRAAEAEIGCMGAVAKASGLRAAEGLRAFAGGVYAKAYVALSEARPALHRVGGSHAQRDVFERLEIEAALRAGLLKEARQALQDRARRRGALDRYATTRLARIGEISEKAQHAAA